MKQIFSILLLLWLWGQSLTAAAQESLRESVVLFRGGDQGYHSFRIPVLVNTGQSLIAFAEGRKNGNSDFGDIDLVFKRSTDGGAVWSPLAHVAMEGEGTWGNPTVLVDGGRVWLFMSWNGAEYGRGAGRLPIKAWGDRRVKLTWSDDDGLSWVPPIDLTDSLLPPGHVWDAIGPGIGVKIQRGEYRGRLVIPASERNIYSDDRGRTWQYKPIPKGTSEGTIVELSNGQLLRNDRLVSRICKDTKQRAISWGTPDLETWSGWTFNTDLADPCSQASMLGDDASPATILFLNPADRKQRRNMEIKVSRDDGNSWRTWRYLDITEPLPIRLGGYSSLAFGMSGGVLALIEQNDDVRDARSHRSIRFFEVGPLP